MRIVRIQCDNCHHYLDIDLDDEFIYCPYCKQKLEYLMIKIHKTISKNEIDNPDLFVKDVKIPNVIICNEANAPKSKYEGISELIGAVFGISFVIFFIIWLIKSSTW